ncbi:ROK family protein [Microbacterium arborescens]
MTLRIGVDVGGTKILAVSVDGDGDEIARLRRPTGWGGDAVADGVAAVVADLAGAAPEVAVGVGVPGQILPGSGVVEHALNLGIDRYDLAEGVAARIGIRPAIDNDVRYAAVGAQALRPAGGSLAYLNLGTGVAAGIVDETGPRRGGRGAAGEIGHVPIDPNGPRCRCGQRGCIEAFAGGGAVAERWGGSAPLPVLAVFDAADAGDERAAGIRADVVRGVEAAVRLLVSRPTSTRSPWAGAYPRSPTGSSSRCGPRSPHPPAHLRSCGRCAWTSGSSSRPATCPWVPWAPPFRPRRAEAGARC